MRIIMEAAVLPGKSAGGGELEVDGGAGGAGINLNPYKEKEKAKSERAREKKEPRRVGEFVHPFLKRGKNSGFAAGGGGGGGGGRGGASNISYRGGGELPPGRAA